MAKSQNWKCPTCGAAIFYDPQNNKITYRKPIGTSTCPQCRKFLDSLVPQ